MSDEDIQLLLAQFRLKVSGNLLMPNTSPLWAEMAEILRAAYNMGAQSVLKEFQETVNKNKGKNNVH